MRPVRWLTVRPGGQGPFDSYGHVLAEGCGCVIEIVTASIGRISLCPLHSWSDLVSPWPAGAVPVAPPNDLAKSEAV